MNKKKLQIAIKDVNLMVVELVEEKTKIQIEIDHNNYQINESKKYLLAVENKEDNDLRFFSPRVYESRYKEQVEETKILISTLQNKNVDLYKQQNRLEDEIGKLENIREVLESV